MPGLKIEYAVPPLFYLAVAYLGRVFTSRGKAGWYPLLNKPDFTPPGSLIGLVWTVIFVLSAISLIVYMYRARGAPLYAVTLAVYGLNGIFNAAWSYFFFTKHMIGSAVIDAGLIWLTVLLMMVLAGRQSLLAALLLLPYLLWVSFAAYLTYVIFQMN